MANAQLYLGDVLIGGEVSAAELQALQGEVTANELAIKDLTDTEIPRIDGEISGIKTDMNSMQAQVDGNSDKIDILANSTVAAKFQLSLTPGINLGYAYVDGGDDWSSATFIQLAYSDALTPPSVFTYADVNEGDIIQIGSSNGKGLFEVKDAGIDLSNPSYAQFDVEPLVTSSGHKDGELVGVTIGSPVDEERLMELIAINAGNIATHDGEIAQLQSDVSDAQASADAKFPQGGTMRSYNTAYELEEAVLDNESAIASLTAGGDPDTDMLKAEAVLNANMKGANPGDPKAGVATIEVVNSLPGITVPTTLYVVV